MNSRLRWRSRARTQFLRLAAGQRHQPCPGLGGDRRLLARSRAIIECRHRTIGHRPLNAALDGLMMHTQCMSYRKERGVFPVRQQHPRPLDPARRRRSRPRYRNQPRHIFISDRQFNRLPPCCHDLRPRSCESEARVKAIMAHVNPAQMISSKESMN